MPSVFNGLGSCVVKDVKAAGVGPQGIPTSYTTRDLNTIEGDTWFCSLNSNQFILQPGKYEVTVIAPMVGYRGPRSKARLWNVSTATPVAYSTGQVSTSFSGTDGANVCMLCIIETTLNVTAPNTIFRLDQRSTSGTQNGGIALGGDQEVYTQIRITKVS